MLEYLRHLRMLSLVFLAGGATGAYAAYGYEHQATEHLASLADRGYCAAKDVDHNRYWYACQDAAVALELQSRAIQHDEETAAILADMAKPTKGKRK